MMTSQTANSTSVHPRPVNPNEVAWQFVPQYYTFLNGQPDRLHCFYSKNSTYSHGTEGEDAKLCYGQTEIHKKIMSLGYENCKVFIHSVDAQSSAHNGVIVQVVGEMSNKAEPWKKFVQTFFLAEQPNGYFVLNDIFKFLREETVNEDEEEKEADIVDEPPTQTLAHEEPVADPAQLSVSVEQVVTSYEPEEPAPQEVPHPVVAPPQVVEREPTPEPEPIGPVEEVHVNGVNGHLEAAESVSDVPEAVAVAEPEPEPVTTIPEPSSTIAVEAPAAVKVPSPAPPSPAPQPSIPPSSVAATHSASSAPTHTHLATGPKTWATLAASNTNKWGSVASDAKGVSAAAPPTPPSASSAPRSAPNGARAHGGEGHPAMQAALSITTAQCFVKSVTENVVETTMRDTLTTRFGPIKELEIVRSKACAFLEFTTIDAAKKAIVASLPNSQGGEGGIRLDGKPGPNNLPPRIIVETRKERGERPPPRPRGGAPVTGEGRGVQIGGQPGETRGAAPGRGRGSVRGRGTAVAK